MSMREAELGCVFKNIFCVSDCVCFLNAPFSSYRPKTKTTAVREIIPGGKGRGKFANHAGANTNTYPPCHDVHRGSPSQFLTPLAQLAQMDILQKHKHTRASDIKNTHTVFENRCRERSVCLRCAVIFGAFCSSFHYSNTPRPDSSHVVWSRLSYSSETQTQHTCWLRGDRWRKAAFLLLYSLSSWDLSLLENYTQRW